MTTTTYFDTDINTIKDILTYDDNITPFYKNTQVQNYLPRLINLSKLFEKFNYNNCYHGILDDDEVIENLLIINQTYLIYHSNNNKKCYLIERNEEGKIDKHLIKTDDDSGMYEYYISDEFKISDFYKRLPGLIVDNYFDTYKCIENKGIIQLIELFEILVTKLYKSKLKDEYRA